MNRIQQRIKWRIMFTDALQASGLSAISLAERLGFDNSLCTLIKRDGHVPRRDLLQRIAKTLGILDQVNDLFGFCEPGCSGLSSYEEPTRLERILRKEYLFTPKLIPFLEELSMLPEDEQNRILAKRDKRILRPPLPEHARYNPYSASKFSSMIRFGRTPEETRSIVKFYCDKLNSGHPEKRVFNSLLRIHNISKRDFERLTYRGPEKEVSHVSAQNGRSRKENSRQEIKRRVDCQTVG